MTFSNDRRCMICGRALDLEQDPLSGSCGGDCWGCIGMIEAEMGHEMSVDFVAREVAWGWREANGSPKSRAFSLANPSAGRKPTPATPIDAALAVIEQHPEQASFVGPRSKDLIAKAEIALGGRLPPAYRRFVESLGAGDYGSVEIYGLIDEAFVDRGPDAVWITLDEREKGSISSDLIIVGDSGDGGHYCIRHGEDGPVHLIAPNGQSEIVASEFGAYLVSRLAE